MPLAITPWVGNTFPTAKSLNLALYTCDGTNDNPNGILFHSYRPILYESMSSASTFTSSTTGVQNIMSTASGSTSSCRVIYDTAGYFGQTQDLPGYGYYQYTAAIAGSQGDGISTGGWTLLSSFVPVKHVSTQTSVSADIFHAGGGSISGSRQAPSSSNDSTPFYHDLVNVGGFTWQPAVTIRDSASGSTSTNVNATDSSGITPRFTALWAVVSETTQGAADFTGGGTYQWTAPIGVTSVVVTGFGAGGGGGAGNISVGGALFGGGGGGGGEFAAGTVAVTPTNNYAVQVGAGGAGGAASTGGAGGNSGFTGDSTTVTMHGGAGGGSATTVANGTGGLGGSGASGNHFNGGPGATGTTGTSGGGGGSSAGTGKAGNAGSGSIGGAAPAGGGPGGSGGVETIGIVQKGGGSNTAGNPLTITFPSALQAGNTIIVCVNRVSSSSPGPTDTGVSLSDGTQLTEISANWQGTSFSSNSLCYSFNVAGGETSYTIGGFGGFARTTTTQWYEVSGLGASPNLDNSNSNTNHVPTSFSVTTTTAGSPDIVFGMVGGGSGGQINIPTIASGWTAQPTVSNNSSGQYNSMRSAYKIITATGSQTFSGSFGSGTNPEGDGVIIAAFTGGAATSGNAPLAPQGGGGGGALGVFGGGNGFDGSVLLTWTGASGGGYGTPPAPNPYNSYGASTTIGTVTGVANVNINDHTGITDVVNFLSNSPCLKINAVTAQSITTGTLTAVTFSGTTPALDNYTGWASSKYTVQRSGIYLFHGTVAFAANSTGTRLAGANVNGTTYWGPGYKAASSGETHCTKTQVFSLNSGDTIQLMCRQDSGGSLALSTTDQTRCHLVWLSNSTSSANYNPPDPTFRWKSGTPGSALSGEFQQFLGNDLGFLCFRPYLLSYQSTNQSGLSNNTFHTVTMDTTSGIVHNDQGDPYQGWSGNSYTAQVNGWYLVTGEVFAASSAAGTATVVAAILPSTSGGFSPSTTPDQYQANSATSTASVGGGATIYGLQYCLVGETITPQIEAFYTGSYSTLVGTQNSGQFNPHMEIVWISE